MTPIEKITIITPCYNAEDHIDETMNSVLNQSAYTSGRVDLQYIICDGGSSDKTLEKVSSFKERCVQVISEPDDGMYHALSKGLQIAEGEVCAYLNAGDIYSTKAFDLVLDVMSSNNVAWITGINVTFNEFSQIINFRMPYLYRRSLIRAGVYGTILPHIVQEGTFWRTQLNKGIDFKKLAGMHLAGDAFLWNCFAADHELTVVEGFLGGFKLHSGQLSSSVRQYHKEKRSISESSVLARLLGYFDLPFWHLPTRVKRMFAKGRVVFFDPKLGKWVQ